MENLTVAEFLAHMNQLLVDGVIDDDSPMLVGIQPSHPLALLAGIPIAVDGECWIPAPNHTNDPYSVPDEIWNGE